MGLKKPRATIQDYGIEKLKTIRQAAQDISKKTWLTGKETSVGHGSWSQIKNYASTVSYSFSSA